MVRMAAVIKDALADDALVDIVYCGAGGALTERRIRPLSFSTVKGSNVVVAYCMLRNDTRTFHLSAIEEARRVP